ncbi:GGDEF domain-containing protein [Cupriavidus sp. WKF15]|nr:GGDEF domain-containing protein [Cupriavidus sp. WKF15]WER47650.1 GGDEF domain-containing protein [Cupriavidus sp. WKF15]
MFQSHMIVLIAGLLALQMAVVCAVLRRSQGMELSGLTSWALGGLVAASGAAMPAVAEFAGYWLAADAVDMALFSGISLMVVGTRHFAGKPGRASMLVVVNLVLAAAMAGGIWLPHIGWLQALRPWMPAALGLGQTLLLLDLVRNAVPLLVHKRGTGRFAALSLVLIAAGCAGLNAWNLSGSIAQPDVPGPLAQDGSLVVLNVFAVVGLSVSFALMAHDRLRRMLERKANHDDLTGLLARGAFWQQLEAASVQADRSGKPLTVAFVDLDHFKAINDVYGHMAGDSVLRHFAGLLRKTVGPQDIIGRLGGEEFAIAMPETTLERGRATSLRLSTTVRNTPCPSEPDAIAYTVSIGIAQREPTEAVENLMRRADQGLYDAKHAGRSCVSLHRTGKPQHGAGTGESAHWRRAAF